MCTWTPVESSVGEDECPEDCEHARHLREEVLRHEATINDLEVYIIHRREVEHSLGTYDDIVLEWFANLRMTHGNLELEHDEAKVFINVTPRSRLKDRDAVLCKVVGRTTGPCGRGTSVTGYLLMGSFLIPFQLRTWSYFA